MLFVMMMMMFKADLLFALYLILSFLTRDLFQIQFRVIYPVED